LQLGLPPLPLPPLVIEQIAATATSVSQLALHLGIDLMHADGLARLSLSLGSLRALLPSLASLLATLRVDLAGAMRLSLGLSLVATARTALGIDLLAPNATLALKLALAARLGAPAPLPAMAPALLARVSAYARLAAAATAFGGIDRLVPALGLVARLQLPNLALPVPALASLSLLVGLRDALTTTPGLDATLPGLQLRLQAAIRPLWSLSALVVAAGPVGGLALPPLGVRFALDAQALAGIGLGTVARLRLPDLAPLSLLASVAGAAALAAPDCCGAH